MKSVGLRYFFFITILSLSATDSCGGFKGMWSDVKSIPIFKGSFWKGLGYGFGAPPTGYDYSYSVYNDTQNNIWVGTQGIISLMGACFPEAGKWNVYPITPGTHYTDINKEYYFEMFIKTTPNSYSNHMPYLQHDDVLYQKDCIQLQNEHSQKHNYFRVYTGREFSNGGYEHLAKAEYLGYMNMNGQKDPNALVFTSTLDGLTIKNSTLSDYYVGFSKQPGLTAASMTPAVCQIYDLVAKDSFGLMSSFGSVTSLCPGTIGLFDATSQKCLTMITIPAQTFQDMSYTIEIYQDAGATVASLGWQGLMSGHYDMPMNRIRDLTPIVGCFWYQSAKQATQGVDLSGSLWVVAKSSKSEILAVATPGQAVQFTITRPEVGIRKQLYFIYVDEPDQKKAEQFIQKFLSSTMGDALVAEYNTQTQSMMQQGALSLQPQSLSNQKAAVKTVIPPTLISQAVKGSLQMNRGQMVDSALGVTGYLLGTDLFLSVGVGATSMYYLLGPSIQNQLNLPTSAVQNLYAQSSVTSAPQGMPAPILNSYNPAAATA